jgi:ubiquinone/menaquinone biosynthesis C-methylase UbiE/esterase/lipase
MNDYPKASLVQNLVNGLDSPAIKGVSISTERLEFMNGFGQKTVAYMDVREGDTSPLGTVLIAPAYGETKEHNLLISAYLAANGFCCVRFDWTDHVGESDGEIFSSTLSKMSRDLSELISYMRGKCSSRNVGILATSLAARAALKMASCDPRPKFLICFAPVVNVGATLKMVYREDLVENFRQGKRYGTLDILGFSIDADNFLRDAIEKSFADISSTSQDTRKITIPTMFFVGQRDSWVQMADAESVLDTVENDNKNLFVLPTSLHRLLENPAAAEKGLKLAIARLLSTFGPECIDVTRIEVPDADRLQVREAEEKAHLRDLYAYSKSEERRFWKKYLGNFHYIINISDYYNLLESIYERLGGAWEGQKILDAGCGIGNYGLFILTKELYRKLHGPPHLSPISYVGVDFLEDATAQASRKIKELESEFKTKASLLYRAADFFDHQFVVADLEMYIPFPDNFFDQVCANFVLSYLQNPDKVIRELWRVLRPGGKIVISSLKPNADLSEVYRNFISVAESPREIEEGRKLLSNAGMIRLKEVVGVYHFYNEKELKATVRKAGFRRVKTFHAFGNQANLVVCSKMQ